MGKDLLICLIGTSGSGKSTIASRLERKFGFTSVKSYTTRAIRTEDEGDINTHTFITSDRVKDFADDMVAYNKYNGAEYFVTREQLKTADLYVVDKAGLIQLYRNYHDKDILSIYIDCDSSIVAQRMEQRGDSDEQIMQRLQYDAEAFAGAKDLCDFVMRNENPNDINDIVDWIEQTYRYYRVRGE